MAARLAGSSSGRAVALASSFPARARASQPLLRVPRAQTFTPIPVLSRAKSTMADQTNIFTKEAPAREFSPSLRVNRRLVMILELTLMSPSCRPLRECSTCDSS